MRNNNNQDNKRVLFVCVENAGRSQIAEGFFNKYAPKGFNPKVQGQNQYHGLIH
jgi:protein-tyrosine-phosphatase